MRNSPTLRVGTRLRGSPSPYHCTTCRSGPPCPLAILSNFIKVEARRPCCGNCRKTQQIIGTLGEKGFIAKRRSKSGVSDQGETRVNRRGETLPRILLPFVLSVMCGGGSVWLWLDGTAGFSGPGNWALAGYCYRVCAAGRFRPTTCPAASNRVSSSPGSRGYLCLVSID